MLQREGALLTCHSHGDNNAVGIDEHVKDQKVDHDIDHVLRAEHRTDHRDAHESEVGEDRQQLVFVPVRPAEPADVSVQDAAQDDKDKIESCYEKILQKKLSRIGGMFSDHGCEDHQGIKDLYNKSRELLAAAAVDQSASICKITCHDHGKKDQHLLEEKKSLHKNLLET